MSSYILKTVKKGDLQNWIATNAAGSVKSKPTESWRAYLVANSGTGATLHDLESSFLAAAGATGGTLRDKWDDYLGRVLGTSGTKTKEKTRNKYK